MPYFDLPHREDVIASNSLPIEVRPEVNSLMTTFIERRFYVERKNKVIHNKVYFPSRETHTKNSNS